MTHPPQAGPPQTPPEDSALHVPAEGGGVEAVKRRLAEARRDLAGFSLDDQPHLTDRQLDFLFERLSRADDEVACQEVGLAPAEVAAWRTTPEFEAVYQLCLANKREAFKLLSTQLLPLGLRTIKRLLTSPKPSAQERGLALLLRVQGLLIDKVERIDRDAVLELVARLREPRPTVVIEGQTHALPTPTASPWVPGPAAGGGDD